MKTAKEMSKYCVKNKTASAFFGRKPAYKDFKNIESALMQDEDVVMCFVGQPYPKKSTYGLGFAYALSNKRILISGQMSMFKSFFQTLSVDMLNDVTMFSKIFYSYITIDTAKEQFTVELQKDIAKNINERIHNALQMIKDSRGNSVQSDGYSVADELLKLKGLLDSGVITQEEFDKQKERLLS